MEKNEFISKYGEAAYEQLKDKRKQSYKKWREQHREQYNHQQRIWYKQHKDQHKQLTKKWHEQHKDQHNELCKKWLRDCRKNGCTQYCNENYELIENYELAKADKFDNKKWHLHHRLENYWSSETLKKKGLYYNVNPEALIWLPYEEHMKDRTCKQSKWHKRILEK